tara:strand:- start:1154 stop:1354 length:201 start_codon:yes stop_codon:yes gene_type:complete
MLTERRSPSLRDRGRIGGCDAGEANRGLGRDAKAGYIDHTVAAGEVVAIAAKDPRDEFCFILIFLS